MYKDFSRFMFMYKVQEKGEKVMEEKKTVKLSEGICCAYCCGDCGWSEPGGDSSGKIWCTRNKAYYYPNESSDGCSGYFTRK